MKKRLGYPMAVLALFGTVGLSGSLSSVAWADTTTTSVVTGTSSAGTVTPIVVQKTSGDPAAAPKLSQDDAVAIVEKTVGIPAGYMMTGGQLQTQWLSNNDPVYTLSWQGPQPQQSGPAAHSFPGFISAVVDANTGTLLSYNGNEGSNWFDAPSITVDQAEQAAKNWLEKLAPSHSGDMQLASDQGVSKFAAPYDFTFVRVVNGVPAPFDGATIAIGPDGSLVSYSFTWHDNVTFPDATPKITVDAATQAYRSALNPQLSYSVNYSPVENDIRLIYQLANPQWGSGPLPSQGPWVSATTGDVLGSDGQPLAADSDTKLQPLDPSAPAQFPAFPASSLTQAQAEAVARSAFKIPDSTTTASVSGGRYQGPGSVSGQQWTFTFQQSDGSQFSVTVDANTGLVSSYNQFPMQPPGKSSGQTISTQDAIAAATKVIEQVYPSLTGVLALAPNANQNVVNNGQIMIQFVLLANGIPTSNSIYLRMDADGKVENLDFTPSAMLAKYPSPDGVISAEQAADDYVQEAPLKLAYELPVQQTTGSDGQVTYQDGSQALLVYAPMWENPYEQLDAASGQWVSTVPGTNPTPTDIDGHSGAQEMAILAQHGVLPVTDGQVHPDGIVTRGQFVQWLVNSTGIYYGNASDSTQAFTDVAPGTTYYDVLQQALAQGWLPAGGSFRPDATLTRGDAAQLIVEWLGWNRLAANSALFAVPFSDKASIPDSELGAATIVGDYGIIPPVNGAFLPGNIMTVADASVAIVHALRVANDPPSQSGTGN
ncbi:MAG: S-layer homology domain-containing protein [Alicyclobacillus sp.]|nr:S-layer homology domain-containing protein [Alicyclobacillus sp.]